jgi:hypothetical protein
MMLISLKALSACVCETSALATRGISPPEQSLSCMPRRPSFPPQVIVQSPAAANHKIVLLFGTSLYDVKQSKMPPASDLTVRDGLRIFTPAAALIRVPEGLFISNPIETQVVLASLRDASELL